eukprot:TRINITY_DN1939_c0_g1_i4.p1 TRINITY_DN1939_c0_g1~~TRINITY_DN1939_c0_g1_i4.p1  ORF type:complete len:774 (+),score=131.21 TRINITY_DN1939_c0_g1_i4:74-2323(+)
MDFFSVEDRDGVRFSWNLWPSSSADAKQLVAPISCLYSPLKQSFDTPMVNYDPIACSCHSLLNPFCEVDFGAKVWSCPFCLNRNRLPSYYEGISPTNLPAELHPHATTIEYALSSGASAPAPAFIFVVDLCVGEEDFKALKSSLIRTLSLIPENSYVGLVTYGSTVNVYELGFLFCPKVHIFDGEKEYTTEDVQKILGLGATGTATNTSGRSGLPPKVVASLKNSMVVPLGTTDLHLTTILEELSTDPRPHSMDSRPLRCTGVALKVTLSMLEFILPSFGVRILLFSGGPATYGPGMLVGTTTKEQMRSWSEINKETAPYIHKAVRYYGQLSEQAVKNGHAIDVFSCSLNQVGLLEMQDLFNFTGGCVFTSESFSHPMFTESLKKMFEKDPKNFLKMGFNCRLEVKTSKELAISGAIGKIFSGRNKSGNIAETQIGIGGTSEWRAAVMDPYSAIGIYFEVNNPRDLPISGKFGVIQFKTTYTHPSGQRMLRCTTLARNWVPKGSTPEVLLSGFDQEATVALISRVAIYKAQTEDIDLLKWLDSHLIRFCRKFAQYQPNNENNFSLPDGMALYPTFMFHLRRSPFVNIFGYSPDETVWYRYYLLKECTGNILIMVQPALDQYTFDREQPLPVLLSPNSLRDDVLLLLDTFFQVVVWSGRTISQWKKANYHLLPEYENLKQLLEAPVTDATSILKERYPHPLYVETEHRESQERYLLAMVDPEAGSQGLNSEDASYSRFLEHLKRYTVKTE